MQQHQIDKIVNKTGNIAIEPDSLEANVATILDVLLDPQANVPYQTLDRMIEVDAELSSAISKNVLERIKTPAEISTILLRLKGYHTTVEAQIKDVVSRERQIAEEMTRVRLWVLDFFRVEHQERFRKEEECIKKFAKAISELDVPSTTGQQLLAHVVEVSRNIDRRYRVNFLSQRAEELIRTDHYNSRIYDEEVPKLIEEYTDFCSIYLSITKATSLALIAPALSESDPESFFRKCSLLIAAEPDYGSVLAPLTEWINLRLGNQSLLSSTNARLEQERMDYGVAVSFWVKTIESCLPEVTRKYNEELSRIHRLEEEKRKQERLIYYHELSERVISNIRYLGSHTVFIDAYREVDDADKQSILEQLAPEFELLDQQPKGIARLFFEPKHKTSISTVVLEDLSIEFLACEIQNLFSDNLSNEEIKNSKSRIIYLSSRMSEKSRKAALDKSVILTQHEVMYASLLLELKASKLTPKSWNEAIASTELL